MLLFLNGTSNNKWDPNENYAREMMELFSLGADRGAYTEDDVREMARALTGWRNDWSEELGSYNFRFDPQLPRHRPEDGVRTDRQLELRRRRAPVRDPPAARLVLRHQAVGLLHRRRALRSHARLAAGPLHRAPATASERSLEAILQHPDFYEGAELRDAAGRLQRRPAALDLAPDRHDRVGVALGQRRPAAVLPAQRLRLGLHPLARHLDREGALGNGQLRDGEDLSRTRGRRKANPDTARPRTPTRRSPSALAYWANPPLSARIRAVHRRLRADVPERAAREVGARAPTGRCARTRCEC